MKMARSSDVKQFRSVLRQSENVVAIAGAGLSAASGLILGVSVFRMMATYIPYKKAYRLSGVRGDYGGPTTP